jgi:glycine/serine hydroxymethyltransferase
MTNSSGLAKEHTPKLIVAGAARIREFIDYAKFRKIRGWWGFTRSCGYGAYRGVEWR